MSAMPLRLFYHPESDTYEWNFFFSGDGFVVDKTFDMDSEHRAHLKGVIYPWLDLPKHAQYHDKLVKVCRITGDNFDHAFITWGTGREKIVPLVALKPAERPKPGRNALLSSYKDKKSKKIKHDMGDGAARLLRDAATLDEVYQICTVQGLEDVPHYRRVYADLNPGLQRMNMGNRLRAFLKRKKEQDVS